MSEEKKRLGDAIFVDIDGNEYLNEIHEKILFNYALRLFQLETKGKVKEFDLLDALRFADLLSKSNHQEASVRHKMWAQEIIVLLNELYPDNSLVKLYAGSVFSSVGNHRGLQKINADYKDISTFERVFAQYRSDYLQYRQTRKRNFSANKNLPMTIWMTRALVILGRPQWANRLSCVCSSRMRSSFRVLRKTMR